ncbi:MAG TPA: ATP-binding cassette domain-containing protein, partial [Sedimentisphaerales bacterium]|nr:ATP-binding cassette domain-containing protein [Sedimentisphaerales bacterium]
MVDAILQITDLNSFFGPVQALRGINLDVRRNEILGIIGPSNSGKTTFLRALNRLNYRVRSYCQTGEILLDGQDLKSIRDNVLRKRIGIIFALPQVLPVTIFENVAYGPKV